MPVLANLFGTVERVAWGMNREPHELRELGELLAFLKQPEPPGGWREAVGMVPLLRAALAMKPRTVARAPCQEVVLRGDEIDLGRLPVQTCWPGEPAPLITWPLVVTKGPSDERVDGFNLGIYRMQVTGRNTHADALAAPSRRRPAPSALAGGAARAAARGRGDRRRSGHHPGRGHAGPGHHVGVPVRGPPARPARSSWSTASRCRSRCRPPPRSCSRGWSASRTTATRARTATTPATTTRSRSSRCSRSPR